MSANETTPNDGTHDGLIRISPSQIKTFDSTREGCERKWAWDKINRVPRGATRQAAQNGIDNHTQIERWLTTAELPWKIASQAIKPGYIDMVPSARLLIEASFSRAMHEVADDTLMTGTIDLVQLAIERANVNRPLLADWKTTKSLQYFVKEEELPTDPQAVVYAKVAMEELQTDVIDARWVGMEYNAKTMQPTGTRKAEHTFTEESIQPEWERIVGVVKKIRHHKLNTRSALDVEPNPLACQAYGGCEYLSICPITKGQSLAAHMHQYEKFLSESEKKHSTEETDSAITQPAAVLSFTKKEGRASMGMNFGKSTAKPAAAKKTNGAAGAATAPTAATPSATPPPGGFGDRLRTLARVNPPESVREPVAAEPPPAAAVTPAPGPATKKPAVKKGGSLSIARTTPAAEPTPVAALQGRRGLHILLDVGYVKGGRDTIGLIDLLEPIIQRIRTEAEVLHWTMIDNPDATLAALLDEELAGTNVTVIVDSSTREAKAVLEVLNKHAETVLRGTKS